MRSLLAVGLFFLAGFIATVDLTPEPRLVVKAYTEQDILREMKREEQQKKIDAASKQALAVFKKRPECRPYAGIVGENAVINGLPARVLAAMAIAESSCNPEAVSPTGDYGIWQINARVWKQRPSVLRNPAYNGAFAARVLRGYVSQSGLKEGLHRYNGLGRPAGEYSDRILLIAYGRPS